MYFLINKYVSKLNAKILVRLRCGSKMKTYLTHAFFWLFLTDGFIRRRVVVRSRPGQLWVSAAGPDAQLSSSPLFLSSEVVLPLSLFFNGSSSARSSSLCSTLRSHKQDASATGDMIQHTHTHTCGFGRLFLLGIVGQMRRSSPGFLL